MLCVSSCLAHLLFAVAVGRPDANWHSDNATFVRWIAQTSHVWCVSRTMQALLGYRVLLYCGVPIVSHPRWGSARLTLHTIVLFGTTRDAAAVLREMLASYRCGVGVPTG